MLPDVRADMIQRQEEETNRFSQSSEAVQWKFQRWKSHSNREVKEVTSGINIYWESITALLGVEATAVKWRGQKSGETLLEREEKKKWQGRLGGTGGKENGEHFEAASERWKCGDSAKAWVGHSSWEFGLWVICKLQGASPRVVGVQGDNAENQKARRQGLALVL